MGVEICTSFPTNGACAGIVHNNKKSSPVETYVVIKDHHKTIQRYYPTGQLELARFQHLILNVNLKKTNEPYTIDLSGAQYRQYAAVVPQQKYYNDWVMGTKETMDFGYMNWRINNAATVQNDPMFRGFDMHAMMVQNDVVNSMNTRIKIWELDHKKTVAQMLDQKQQAYEKDKTSLLDDANRTMQDAVAFHKAGKSNMRGEYVNIKDLPRWEDKRKDDGAQPTVENAIPQHTKDLLKNMKQNGSTVVDISGLPL